MSTAMAPPVGFCVSVPCWAAPRLLCPVLAYPVLAAIGVARVPLVGLGRAGVRA